MKQLIIYKSGERCIMDGMTLGLSGGIIEKEINLNKATDSEFQKLKQNLHDDTLIAEIEKRK